MAKQKRKKNQDNTPSLIAGEQDFIDEKRERAATYDRKHGRKCRRRR